MFILQGSRILQSGQVEYPRWLLLLKIAKTSSSEPVGIIGYKFAWNMSGTLVFKIVIIIIIIKKNKKTAELGHSIKLEKSFSGIVPALWYNNLCIRPF